MCAPTTVQITIIYDNYVYDPSFRPGSGFSCAIRSDAGVVLFDAGGHISTLSFNLRRAGIGPQAIKVVAISHLDSDHYGGLLALLEKTTGPEVYVPAVFPGRYKEKIRARGAAVREVTMPQEIFRGVFTIGQAGRGIKEQSLVLDAARGGILIVACSHPGIVHLARTARQVINKPLDLIIGGFHLGGMVEEGLKESCAGLRALGVTRVAPSHCTTDGGMAFLRHEFQQGFIESGVGKTIEISPDTGGQSRC